MKRGGPLRRRTPLGRGRPLESRGPMRRGEPLRRSSPLRARSRKRAEHMATERVPLVRSLIAEGARCGICPLLDMVGIAHPKCVGIQGIHERRKSGAGGSRVNPANLIPACNASNSLLEDEPDLVRDLLGTALIVRSGDDEWADLSKRNDRP